MKQREIQNLNTKTDRKVLISSLSEKSLSLQINSLVIASQQSGFSLVIMIISKRLTE